MKKNILSIFLALLLAIPFFYCIYMADIANATVTNTTNQVIYNGDGITTVFPFTFNVYNTASENDLLVQEIVVSTGNVTTLAINTDYTVSLNGNIPNNGSITLVAGALPTGTNLSILRNLPLTQNVNEVDNSATPAAVRNNVYDRNIMIDQQLYKSISLAVLQNNFSTSGSVTLPAPVLGQYLVWGAGNTLTNSAGNGAQGPAGQGVPTGGATGAVLTKNSSSNYDASWTAPATHGTVTSVTSANGDITVANTTTIPVITLNSGTTANKIVKLDGSAKLPAVDGSQLTHLPSTSSFVPNNIQVFTSTGTWSQPVGISNAYIKVWAGGAGAFSDGNATHGAGGGGGGYSEGFTAVTTNVTVTVGTGGAGSNGGAAVAGGTSSFAGTTTIQATGGGAATSGVAGVGGVGSNGQINISGSVGGTEPLGGWGGSSFGGTITPFPTGNTVGNNAITIGGGGSSNSGTGNGGGSGKDGLVIVYY